MKRVLPLWTDEKDFSSLIFMTLFFIDPSFFRRCLSEFWFITNLIFFIITVLYTRIVLTRDVSVQTNLNTNAAIKSKASLTSGQIDFTLLFGYQILFQSIIAIWERMPPTVSIPTSTIEAVLDGTND